LEEYQISIGELRLFASKRSVGEKIKFKGKDYLIKEIFDGSFKDIDFTLFSAGASVSKAYARQAVNEGSIVIDNSSAYRMNELVPLVVPEVNISDVFGKNLIANPNCSTIQAVVPLKVLDDYYKIECIEYNTYQAVSGAGQKGNDFFPYNIKETCIPQIDVFLEDGYTKEEHKMIEETRKILHNNQIKISATCVRVPVINSHAVSIRVTFKQNFKVEEIKSLFAKQPGLVVLDDPSNLIYPVSTKANGNDLIYVGRIRKDKINNKTLLLYVVADNIRKGAAANAIQIMKGTIDYENTI
jgi:aspartate-semialdehyde dehydrogenase